MTPISPFDRYEWDHWEGHDIPETSLSPEPEIHTSLAARWVVMLWLVAVWGLIAWATFG